MKRKRSTNDKPNQILMFSTSTAADEVKVRLTFRETVKQVQQRACAASRPKDNDSPWTDYQQCLKPNHRRQPLQLLFFCMTMDQKLINVSSSLPQGTSYNILLLQIFGVWMVHSQLQHVCFINFMLSMAVCAIRLTDLPDHGPVSTLFIRPMHFLPDTVIVVDPLPFKDNGGGVRHPEDGMGGV